MERSRVSSLFRPIAQRRLGLSHLALGFQGCAHTAAQGVPDTALNQERQFQQHQRFVSASWLGWGSLPVMGKIPHGDSVHQRRSSWKGEGIISAEQKLQSSQSQL